MKIHPQIITKNNSPAFVVLPYVEYEAIVDVLEDQIDIREIEAFYAGNQETFPMEVAQKLADGQNPIKVFRELRGLSQSDFVKKAGISRQYLHQLEHGIRKGSAKTLKKIADALGVEVDLLIH